MFLWFLAQPGTGLDCTPIYKKRYKFPDEVNKKEPIIFKTYLQLLDEVFAISRDLTGRFLKFTPVYFHGVAVFVD